MKRPLTGTEAYLIDQVDDLPEIVPALQPVFQLAENFTDLLFNGICHLCFELFRIKEQPVVYKMYAKTMNHDKSQWNCSCGHRGEYAHT